MATLSVPDPMSLSSWDEAFQYPLPTVRKLTTRLRRDIDEHRSRLRSLVGTSYRDLLGTAERIIEMDKQIQSVEHSLSDIGRRCNSNILERGDTNYVQLERAWSQRGGHDTRLRNTAQCKILDAALSVVNGLIRARGDSLQAAKLMILTRLLYKSLSDADNAPTILERHRRSIASFRNKLLGYIDRKIGQEDATAEELVGALTAYALLTSSTPKDVLRHLLAVRIAQVESLTSNSTADSILKALSLYTSTFVSVQTVFPKRLAERLSALSKMTLLSDKHVKGVEELNLDIYGRWIPEDVRSFTPWVQQDNLTASEGRQAMSDYSTDAREILLRGLKQCLAGINSANTVLDVRKKVMGATLSIGTRVKLAGFLDHLEEFREVFLARLEHLVQATALLDDFDPGRATAVNGTKPGHSIWDLAQDDFDLSAGGLHFRKAILRQRNGHDAAFDRVMAPFEGWRVRIEALWSIVEAIRASKWDEHVEHDVDEPEDEEVAPFQDMLSSQDAVRLEARLHRSVVEAIAGSLHRFEQATQHHKERPQFYLRIFRELQKQQLQLSRLIGLNDESTLSRHDLSKGLHLQLAQIIADHGIDELRAAYTSRHYIPVELWEKSPKLPLQPLPATFRFVMTIQQEMARVGEDVWSTAAVIVLKQAIRSKLAEVIALVVRPDTEPSVAGAGDAGAGDARIAHKNEDAAAPIDNSSNDETNISADEESHGDAVAEIQETDRHTDPTTTTTVNSTDLAINNIQRLFDAFYVARVFDAATSALEARIETLKTRAALNESEMQRLEKNAIDYWKKTYLLFGLLAHSNTSYSKQR